MKKILIIIDYFSSEWPVWMNVYLKSCALNPTIDWVIHSNMETPESTLSNVEFRVMAWADYVT
jgi:hypothetical protein